MSAQPTRRWKRLIKHHVPEQVGFFFEEMTMQLAEGLEREHGGDADFVAWQLDTAIEVKGCDNTHPIRIPVDQLARYAEVAGGFPYSHALYFIYRYCNRSPGMSKTGLIKAKTPELRTSFLFQQLRDLWILDHRLLHALSQGTELRINAFPLDPERRCLSVTQRDLSALFNADWHERLAHLGFAPEEWICHQRAMRLETQDNLLPLETSLTVRSLTHADLAVTRLVKPATKLTIRLPALDLTPALQGAS